MSAKEQAIIAINKLPKEATIDDILDELIFIRKVNAGLKDSEAGNVKSNAQAKEQMSKWLK